MRCIILALVLVGVLSAAEESKKSEGGLVEVLAPISLKSSKPSKLAAPEDGSTDSEVGTGVKSLEEQIDVIIAKESRELVPESGPKPGGVVWAMASISVPTDEAKMSEPEAEPDPESEAEPEREAEPEPEPLPHDPAVEYSLPEQWAAAFTVEGGVDHEHSLNVLTSVPFENRWDANRGVYRPMARLEVLEGEVLAALGSAVHYTKAAGTGVVVETAGRHMSVDHVELFMRFVSALQVLLQKYPVLLDEVQHLEAEQAAFSLGVVRYAEEIKSSRNKKSAAEMRMERHLLGLQVRLEEVSEALEAERLRTKSNYAEVKTDMRRDLRDEHEATLLNTAEQLSAKLRGLTEAKLLQLETLFFRTENATFAHEEEMLAKENDAQLRAVEGTIEMALDAIRFKAEAESEIENDNIDLHLNMINAKGQASIRGFESVVTKVFEELVTRAHGLAQEPSTLLKGAAVLLGFLVTLLLAYEAGIIARHALLALFNRREVVNRHTRMDGSAFAEFTSVNDVLLSATGDEKLRAYMHQLREAAAQQLALPNLLITGPAGVGKTMAAAVAALENSDLHPSEALPPVAVIPGGDLLALEGAASAFLRRVLDNSLSGRGCLVVLDGFDDIIAKRDGSEHSAHHDTLCTLLYSLRMNSTTLGVIVTSSLTHSEIDAAVLDRMDSVMQLQLPSNTIRATLVRRYCLSHLDRFLDEASRTWLQSEDRALFSDANALNMAVEEECGPERTCSPTARGRKACKGATTTTTAAAASLAGPGLDVRRCLLHTVMTTAGLSHREVTKVMKNVHNGVLATEEFVLTNDAWMGNIRPKDLDGCGLRK
jgi:hypothetical protein